VTDDGQPASEPGLRMRIMEANQAAAEFYSAALTTPDALAARQFLDGRGFDRAAAEHFGVGYAPRGGRDLRTHLQRLGFKDAELVRAGLVRESGHDFFQGRALWPIRDSGRSVLGFGARRLYDDDRMPAKYLNTPETPLYKKSHVLYGLDLARQAIGKSSQAVIVEGYTDVMAAHLSGVETAVASCGTAFGDDHARLLQRLMGHQGAFTGEVIFTFDGDQAGQNAALKVFSGDQNFVSQTYVAIEPNGLDPCDLRLQHGEAAVRELVGRRVPLYTFVMKNVIAGYDLDRVDGRLSALRAAVPLISSIRDTSLISGYVRELASMIGLDVDEVRAEVARVGRRKVEPPRVDRRHHEEPEEQEGLPPEPGLPWPDPADRGLAVERGTLKLMLQRPLLFDSAWNGVKPDDFRHPAYRAVFEAIRATPYEPERWTDKVIEATPDETAAHLEVALLVEQVLREPDEAYAAMYASTLQLIGVTGEIRDVKSRLQRTNPVEHEAEHKQMFARLLALESRRKVLQQLSVGAVD
ncbi:MAG TPA: toprim domain-containing protein, partial [Propionibacteriaceae bacterium]|nr:toprim domain-containing protein [Propionibacteriaceae bacterium]